MRGRFLRKPLTWTRSLQGRMRVWLPPIGKITLGGGLWTPNLQRTWPIAWRKRRLSWREGSSNPSLRCHMLSNKWAGSLLYREKHQEATQAAEEAIQRNPNYADGYALWALVLIYMGKPEEGLHKSQEAIERDPIYPFFYDYYHGHAYYVWGVLTSAQDPNASRQHFEEAEEHLREALRKNDNFRTARSFLVAVLIELDRKADAVKEVQISLEKQEPLFKLLKSDPQLAEEYIRRLPPYTNQEIRTALRRPCWRRRVEEKAPQV